MDRVDQKWQQLSKTAAGKEAKPPTTFNEIKCQQSHVYMQYIQYIHSTNTLFYTFQ